MTGYKRKGEKWGAAHFGCYAIAFLSLWGHLSAQSDLECPRMCRCTKSPDEPVFKYVVCRGNITDLKHLELPRKTLWLNLSGISLKTIPPYHFLDKGIVGITELDLSYNRLRAIYTDIFIGLNDLRYLDLSYNEIEFLDPRCLIYNNLLTHVMLRGTNIKIPPHSSLIVSTSLKILDVSGNRITTLPKLIFSELPALLSLNISNNPINTIDVDLLSNTIWLRELDITNTTINCDERLMPLSEWGKQYSVSIKGYPCRNSLQNDAILRSRPPTKVAVKDAPEWVTPIVVEQEDPEEEPFGAEAPKFTHLSTLPPVYEPTSEDSDLPSSDSSSGFDWERFRPDNQWTLWLACGGGFALQVALLVAIVVACFACCRRRTSEANESVPAGEEFQLVHVEEAQDLPPSYSSLFSKRYMKVLPTTSRLRPLK